VEGAPGGAATLTAGALTTAATVGEVLAGAVMCIFSLAVFLYAGSSIWDFTLRAVPAGRRSRVDVAGRRGLAALVAYTRATAVVAAVDAVAIGIGLGLLGVPVAAALAALVFLGAFIPILGSRGEAAPARDRARRRRRPADRRDRGGAARGSGAGGGELGGPLASQ
jgi:predicted PurR-regulated permease PerM